MPVHREKKDTTPTPPGSTQEQLAPSLPDQQAFHLGTPRLSAV